MCTSSQTLVEMTMSSWLPTAAELADHIPNFRVIAIKGIMVNQQVAHSGSHDMAMLTENHDDPYLVYSHHIPEHNCFNGPAVLSP